VCSSPERGVKGEGSGHFDWEKKKKKSTGTLKTNILVEEEKEGGMAVQREPQKRGVERFLN